MPAEMLIKSREMWYKVAISFRGQPNNVFPWLKKDWNTQEAADLILDTCGSGVKMLFVNAGKPNGDPAKSVSENWYDGESFDHSPSWSNSPINPLSSKMVGMFYHMGRQGRHNVKKIYKTLEEANKEFSCKFVYVWNGEEWKLGDKSKSKSKSKSKRLNPWRKRS